jgi:23S rRNA (cytosine1962-C5)-methyltransferase
MAGGLVVKPRARIFHGHEWVYASDVQKTFGQVEAGSVVSLKDFKDRSLGSAIYNPQSQIVARRFSRHREDLTLDFFRRRLQRAWARRERMEGLDREWCRVVWSESDGLLDRYGAHFVLQTLTLAMDQRKDLITQAVVELFSPTSVVERNDNSIRLAEGMEQKVGVLHGSAPEPFRRTWEFGSMVVDLVGGQKTGIYLDQWDNYRDTAARFKGRRVLDCFSNQGGFALACALAGASHVTAVDISESAIAAAQENAAALGVADRMTFVAENVFDFLKRHEAAPPEVPWEAIILDPPSFTRSKQALAGARRGYKEIHFRAMKLLSNGGLLSTFCCSHHVSTGDFRDIILEAAVDAKRTLAQVATHAQRGDHPIMIGVPESEYLRGFTFELLAAF